MHETRRRVRSFVFVALTARENQLDGKGGSMISDAPVCSFGGEHGTDEVYRIRTFFTKALQAMKRLLVPQDVEFALETIAEWMSAVRKAVIVETTEGEYVDRLCQPRPRLP